MKTKAQVLLLHPFFLISLLLLLLNDFYFKYEFHNWLTGKLSDFTGLFVFSVFLLAFFPLHKKIISWLVLLLFLWWKSPFSDPLITFLNNLLPVQIHRVIDYTDYVALVVIPLASYTKPVLYSPGVIHSITTCLVATIALFSFSATSMYRGLMYYPYRHNEIRIDEYFRSRMTADQILQKLDAMRLDYYRDSVRFYPAEKYDFYYRIQSEKDSTIKWQAITSNPDSSIYVRRADGDFYVLPQYVIDGDTLHNVEFTIRKNTSIKKPSTVFLESFITSDLKKYYNYYNSKTYRKYKKSFRKLFE